MLTNVDALGTKVPKKCRKYRCEKCDYETSHVSHWKKHCETKRHKKVAHVDKMLTNVDKMLTSGHKSAEKWHKSAEKLHATDNFMDVGVTSHVCACGKTYSYRQSLSVHKKRCTFSPVDASSPRAAPALQGTSQDSVMNLKTATILYETVKLLTTTGAVVGNGNNNRCHIIGQNNGKTQIEFQQNNGNNFNIQLFLDKDCQNAISIQNFVKSLAITVNELTLLKNDEPKMIEGVIRKGLEEMPITTRPLHSHKEDWYVKDETDGWEKDSGEKLVNTVKSGISRPLTALVAEQLPKFQTSEMQSRQYGEIMQAVLRDPSNKTVKKVLTNLKDDCEIGKDN